MDSISILVNSKEENITTDEKIFQNMNKKILVWMVVILFMAVTVTATDIEMKSNEIYTAQFKAENTNNLYLKNCIPYMTGNLDQEFIQLIPSHFALDPGERQDIVFRVSHPTTGYYSGDINIKCERYDTNLNFLDVVDILNPRNNPTYSFLVLLAGEGQSYVFITGNKYEFIANPGQVESADIILANIGTVDLPVEIQIPQRYLSYIEITPTKTTIDQGERQIFKIKINTPDTFTTLNTKIPITIGDYQDEIIIKGETESFAVASAGLQSITGNSVSVGNKEVPSIVPIIGLLLLLFLVIGKYHDK